MLPMHVAAAPESAAIGTRIVPIVRLEDEIPRRLPLAKRIFVKSDTQGYEREVVAGLSGVLDRIAGLQLELSLVPLYEGEMLLLDMCEQMAQRGFQIIALEPGFSERNTGRLLQVDTIFFRAE
jgi:hypothetical protein